MRDRVADLTEPQASRDEQGDAGRQGQAGGAGDRPGHERQGGKAGQPKRGQQGIGGGKLLLRCIARNPWDQQIKGDGSQGDVKQGQPGPDAAQGQSERQKCQGAGGGKGKEAERKRAHGASVTQRQPLASGCVSAGGRAVIRRSGLRRAASVACHLVP